MKAWRERKNSEWEKKVSQNKENKFAEKGELKGKLSANGPKHLKWIVFEGALLSV